MYVLLNKKRGTTWSQVKVSIRRAERPAPEIRHL